MQPSALTSENSAVVMIDHAIGFGNVFRSHDQHSAAFGMFFQGQAARQAVPAGSSPVTS